MKKKTIEKIPYLGLKGVSRKKSVKYIAVTAVKIVGHEKHLFTEVYRNKKKDLHTPVVRIVLTKKDFGTYFVESGEWYRGKICESSYYSDRSPIWDRGWSKDAEKENILRSDEDLIRIRKFTGIEEKSWRKQYWWEILNERIDKIATEERMGREKRRYERRRQALKERMENTSELDEEKILDYAERVIFREKHYLYYKKHGVRARVACSKCGGVTERRWKPGTSYESQFEPTIEEPRKGYYGTCPMCGARGEWMPQGKAKEYIRKTAHIFLGQKYKETGMVFRYIELWKEYKLGLLCEGTETVMKNAWEEVSAAEIARAYFEEGKKLQIDYHKSGPFSGDYWDDCNLYGMASISIRAAPILEETYEAMKGTFLRYSAMQEYEKAADEYINPINYAERYLQIPQIEMLTKLGLIKVVEKLVNRWCSIVANKNANRVDAFLGIRKEHVRLLIRHQGDESILNVLQVEKRMDQHWTDGQIENLAELSLERRNGWIMVLEHMGMQKMLNLISKYAGAEYGTGCSRATERLREVAQTYFDYINMRRALGYDMSNTVYLAPRDLNAEHRKMAMEQNKEEAEKRIKEVDEMYPLIKKHYRRLRKKFFYEDEDFIIRPARDAEEIVMEGRILHHCVGGNNYLSSHNDGITTILFLRSKKEPDVPYITVEIGTENLKLIQWYGAHDKKPDEENMGRWLKKYVAKLRCGLIGAGEEAGKEAEPQALAITA